MAEFEGAITPIPGLELDESALLGFENPEQMFIAGAVVRVYNLLKLSGNYGLAIDKGNDRSSVAGSVGIYQKEYSFIYTLSQPHLEYDDLQSALTLQVFMKI